MQLKITADYAPITASLNRLMWQLGDLSEPMERIGGVLEGSTTDRIRDTKISPDGEDWEDTKIPKPRSQLLIGRGMQGGLLRGITSVASQNSVIVGSNKLYAAYLQEGTSRMVARPFLGISADDQLTITEMIEDWLINGFEEN